MGDANYVGAASCRMSGVHHLDGKGSCVVCKQPILSFTKRAATETAAATKKGSAAKRSPPRPSR
jgi:hypothetical protein